MKRFFLLLFLTLTVCISKSQTYDDLQVSLLTVEPRSKAVYTIFGHTALRLYDPTRDIDAVLNWGTFDFDKPNFLWLFVKGETDYFLSASPSAYFNYSYSQGNSTVKEQILNIPGEQKAALMDYLSKNLEPENIEYRYNFIFDNCTTRPRDIIEQFCGGNLTYPKQTEPVTFRELLHECTAPYPWVEFGIDCIIGNGADSLISRRSELFLPALLMNALDKSVVKISDGSEYPIVLSTHTVMQSESDGKHTGSYLNLPLIIGFIIFLIYLTLIIIAYRNKRRFRGAFSLLFLIAGIGGCIVAIIGAISLHPCTWPNWNIIWLHPLHLIGFTGFLLKKSYPVIRWYHAVNFVILSLLLLGWYWIPQQLNPASIPFSLCLWIVSGFQLLSYKKKLYE